MKSVPLGALFFILSYFYIMMLPSLFVAPSRVGGRGVYSSAPIAKNTTIEISPVIVMSHEERLILDKTTLHDYIFEWGYDHKQCCMALGYIPLYNHSYESNCEYEMDFENGVISIKAVQDINAGEELFINYNGDWNDPLPVWFETR
jgi:SET domain-containing protein